MTQAISDLPDFPFPDYATFVSAVHEKDAQIGIEYAAAMKLVEYTRSPAVTLIFQFITAVPVLLLPASAVLAIIVGSWEILAALPAIIVGMVVASPHNPLHKLCFLVAWAAMIYGLFFATAFTVSMSMSLGFGLSYLIHREVRRTAWRWARNTILHSEGWAVDFWEAGNLHVQTAGIMHTR